MYKIYGLSDCNYCKNATVLLQARGLSYAYFALDNNEQVLSEIKQENNWRTVPMIFFTADDGNEHFVGGYDNLVESLRGK